MSKVGSQSLLAPDSVFECAHASTSFPSRRRDGELGRSAAKPTPSGVPVAMIEPGGSVIPRYHR